MPQTQTTENAIALKSRYVAPTGLLNSVAFQTFREACCDHPDEETCAVITQRRGTQVLACHILENRIDQSQRREVFSGGVAAAKSIADCKLYGSFSILCHSHPRTVKQKQYFTTLDVSYLRRWRMPGLLAYGKNFAEHTWLDESASASLVNRPWRPIESNCYTLIRDYLLNTKQVNLGDRIVPFLGPHVRSGYEDLHLVGLSKSKLWLLLNNCLVRKNHKLKSQYQIGDVIVFEGKGDWPVHMAIFCGGDRILHQPYGQRSKRDAFSIDDVVGLFQS